MELFCIAPLIFMLAVLLFAAVSDEADRLEPHESIRTIGSQARREAEDLSEEVLIKAIELLTQKRR